MVKDLNYFIIKGIQELKGEDIVLIDLSKLSNTICDYFIICHGNSSTHVNSIIQSVAREVREGLKVHEGHTEGFENAQWMLIDYFNTVVHVFQRPTREYYRLEDLWADGITKKITTIYN